MQTCKNNDSARKGMLSFPERYPEFASVMAEIGNDIFSQRISQKLTQKQLSSKTSVSPAIIRSAEHGQANLSLNVLCRLASGLKAPEHRNIWLESKIIKSIPEEVSVNIKNNIRQYRKTVRESQAKLAKHCGVSLGNNQRAENGNDLTIATVCKIASHMKINWIELLNPKAEN